MPLHLPTGAVGFPRSLVLLIAALAAGMSCSADVLDDELPQLGDEDPTTVTFGLDARPPNHACQPFSAPPTTTAVRWVDKFPDVPLDMPVGLFQRPGDDSRWYVAERAGVVKRFPNAASATAADVQVVLDLSDITYAESNCSLSSIAFPADFATSHVAYVTYCHQDVGAPYGEMQQRLSRFTTHDGGDTFDRESEEIIVAIEFSYEPDGPHDVPGRHSLGAMAFGPDGYLYMAIGDNGPHGDGGGAQAQDTNDLRGKMLRLDVSDLGLSLPDDGFVPGRQRTIAGYPPDNPFVNGGGHPAVFAFGFRNPWAWHFDRGSPSADPDARHPIWLGDVGYDEREEIDRDVKNGGNYGWAEWEGFECRRDPTSYACNGDAPYIAPFLDYTHGAEPQQGNAVTGGVVYRGTNVPSLTGAYIFGDSARGWIWAVADVDHIDGKVVPAKTVIGESAYVGAFAEDQQGEVYAAILFPAGQHRGSILALEVVTEVAEDGVGGPPDLLSQTGCFDPLDVTRPADGLIPFTPRADLWSDGASKRRWMVVPDGTSVTVSTDGDFSFPAGSMLVKEFTLAGSRIETRFLVHQASDDSWAGYSYRWNDEQTDAALVAAEGAVEVRGGQEWFYPSRAECGRCHTEAAGVALGPEVRQLNHDMNYESSGRVANQLRTLNHIGLLDMTAYTATPSPLAAVDDETRSIADRARSYLHANCSHCHRPGGSTFTMPDFRFGVDLASMGICDVVPTVSNLEDYIPTNPLLLAPGAPERSVLLTRMQAIAPSIRMPPLGRSLTHDLAVDVIAAWIREVTECPASLAP